MSTQSILIQNRENHQAEFVEKLLSMGDAYTLQRRFMIGKDFDFRKMMFIKSFNKLLCNDNCELISFIDRKIRGKLEDCGVSCGNAHTTSDLCILYQQNVKSDCSVTQITEDCCNWAEAEW